MDDFRHLCDMDTGKILAAAATPFLVWGANLEMFLKIGASAGAVLYIAIKIVLLLINRKP